MFLLSRPLIFKKPQWQLAAAERAAWAALPIPVMFAEFSRFHKNCFSLSNLPYYCSFLGNEIGRIKDPKDKKHTKVYLLFCKILIKMSSSKAFSGKEAMRRAIVDSLKSVIKFEVR